MLRPLWSPDVKYYHHKLAPNNTIIETPYSIEQRSAAMIHVAQLMPKEMAAGYAAPLTGTSPMGLGLTLGDTWRRTEHSPMEFQLPFGQEDVINKSLRYAFENVFVGKALRLKTNFTCKGLSNGGPNEQANDFFDSVHKTLNLQRIYRQAVWLYYTVGLVPILLTEPGKQLGFVEILDPRMVRIARAFGKVKMWLLPDKRMLNAVQDPKGERDVANRLYYNSMPAHWKAQLIALLKGNVPQNQLRIELKDGEYLVIENRYTPVDRYMGAWDGAPLQHYFNACEQYRMLCAGDFAAAFLMKNIIALVSAGDPKGEGERYIRPDDKVLADLQAAFQNPNSAQWAYVDPTVNIRYITPDPKVFGTEKYAECTSEMKNLLPAPFWYTDGGGSFAAATTQLSELQEECDQCNDTFDTDFWTPIHERAASTKARIGQKDCRPPKHDRNALKDNAAYLTGMNNLYANGGLSVPSLMEAHGIDPKVEIQRLKDQQPEVKAKTFMPAFEQKQNIVAAKTYGLDKTAGQPRSAGMRGKGGRPRKTGSTPKSESQTRRAPRPSEK